MWSKSKAYSFVFILLSLFLLFSYTSGHTATLLTTVGFSGQLADVFTFLALGSIALVSMLFGGNPLVIISTGTVVGFVVLTLNQVPLVRYLTLAALLFALGVYGMIMSRNAIRVLISIELILSAVNINLVAFARFIDPQLILGQLFTIFTLTVAAAEAAVGLAIVLAMYRNSATVDMEKFNILKW